MESRQCGQGRLMVAHMGQLSIGIGIVMPSVQHHISGAPLPLS